MNADVIVKMEIAESQARAAGTVAPCVWYCTHLLGERIVIVVNADVMSGSATWPGDLVTTDTAAAAEWLSRPPEQAEKGVPPESPSEPSGAEQEPANAPPGRAGLILSIARWVSWWHGGAVEEFDLDDSKRTPDHSAVEVVFASGYVPGLGTYTGLELSDWPVCVCGRVIDPELKTDECPAPIGCSISEV